MDRTIPPARRTRETIERIGPGAVLEGWYVKSLTDVSYLRQPLCQAIWRSDGRVGCAGALETGQDVSLSRPRILSRTSSLWLLLATYERARSDDARGRR